MRKTILFLFTILSIVLISGCSTISPVSVIALDVDYLNNTNQILYYNGSIDITGAYLVNGTTIFDWDDINATGGGGTAIAYTPINSTYNYNDSQLINIIDVFVEKTKETNIFYNSTSGLIQQAIINDTINGLTTINYTYVDGLLTGVTY